MSKCTRELKEFWWKCFESKEYQASAKQRMLDGKAPHLESYLLSKIYGKPPDHVYVSGPNEGPIEVHDHFVGSA